MRKTLKYRLYTSRKDKRLIERIEVAASVWNHCIALHRRYYRLYRKSLGASRLMRHVARLRNGNPYWKKLGSQALQDVVQRIEKSYRRFFSDPRAGKPGFKKRKKYPSFTLKQAGWSYLAGNRIRIGGHSFKFVLSRPLEGEIKTVTIKRDRCGALWVCFSVVQETPQAVLPRTGNAVGMDFGLKDFLTLSTGDRVASPQHLKASLRELAKLNRSLSRKKPGSRNRNEARIRKARLERRIADRRRDFHFKAARAVLERFDLVAIEELNLDGMKRLWGRKVSDLGFRQFVDILKHVAAANEKEVVGIDRYFASSKTCSGCGAVNRTLTLKDREWVCADCGALHDRDLNAAVNILDRALSGRVGEVRPRFDGAIAVGP